MKYMNDKDGRQRGFEVVSAYMEKGIELPARKTGSSAGYDIQAAEDVTLLPHQVTLVPTVLGMALLCSSACISPLHPMLTNACLTCPSASR